MFVKLFVKMAAAVLVMVLGVSVAWAQDPLPSWNEGDTKAAIIDFVTAVTDESNKDLIMGKLLRCASLPEAQNQTGCQN